MGSEAWHLEVAGADVADVVPVVNVLGSSRQQGLEVLHAGEGGLGKAEAFGKKLIFKPHILC